MDRGPAPVRVDDEGLRRLLQPPPTDWRRTTLRRAAVLAPLFAAGGEDWLLFVVRRPDLRKHAGQIAFPGGGAEGDEGPISCALRELAEETGITAGIEMLGELQTRQSSSGMRVHCLVARVPEPRELQLDTSELERAILVPLRQLCAPDAYYMHAPPRRPPWPESPHFNLGDDGLLWGLTGRFTLDLIEAVKLARR
jgi:8-oxo-dGTP pyrophosphatase MutT (NUDIX family)